MNLIFNIVAGILSLIARITGFTYEEINIIAYYILLPFVYVFLADKIIKSRYLRVSYIAIVFIIILRIPDFEVFSRDLFEQSREYLLTFELFGWNYIVSSVIICVIFPFIVFMGMLHFAYPKLYPFLLSVLKAESSDEVRERLLESVEKTEETD